jgi:addiction module RelE/StbE family toxin
MKVVFHKRFRKKLHKCDPVTQEKIYEKLRHFAQSKDNPILKNHALSGEYAGYRSIDIKGDLRALYKEAESEVFEFCYLGTHHELYGS